MKLNKKGEEESDIGRLVVVILAILLGLAFAYGIWRLRKGIAP